MQISLVESEKEKPVKFSFAFFVGKLKKNLFLESQKFTIFTAFHRSIEIFHWRKSQNEKKGQNRWQTLENACGNALDLLVD